MKANYKAAIGALQYLKELDNTYKAIKAACEAVNAANGWELSTIATKKEIKALDEAERLLLELASRLQYKAAKTCSPSLLIQASTRPKEKQILEPQTV